MKLLVVDDDLATGTLLDKVLAKKGFEVTHVTNGADALTALQKDNYRIVLTDWMMPQMNGPTLCRHIREMKLPHYIYVILLTAKSAKDDAVAGLDAGADDYIVKPFNHHELIARIRAGQRLVELEDTNRATQIKLARSEKLAATGSLAAGVAHEINNPIGFVASNLNSLKTYMDSFKTMLASYRQLARVLEHSVSQNRMQPELPGLLQKALQMEAQFDIEFLIRDTDELIDDCAEGVSRVKSIVQEMRYFLHPEKQVIEPCNLGAIVKDAVSRISSGQSSGIALESSIDGLPIVECNAPHLEQAFVNILQNAVEAAGSQGMITISGAYQSDSVQIKICDTGAGIAPEHLSQVFDPFFTTKEVGQGLGMGLTTAQNIIKMHNGTIDCESQPSEKTCFTTILPLTASAFAKDAVNAAGKGAGGSLSKPTDQTEPAASS